MSGITCVQGETDYHKASSFVTAGELIESLKDDTGNIGKASQEALEEAKANDPSIAAAYVEEVE